MAISWVIVQDETSDHWMELTDPDGWYYAKVNQDGCVHFYRYFNTPRDPSDKDEDPDYLHICNIEQEIERLIMLKEIATQHFGDSWLQGKG